MNAKDIALLEKAVEVAQHARDHGNHPFGALLADQDGNILITAENSVVTEKDCTCHAETNLMRLASHQYDPDFLNKCSVYTSCEPCPMCAGAMYWAGVGRMVYALSELQLLEMTGNHPENPTCTLSCREVFASGQHPVVVEGPVELTSAREIHQDFWKKAG